MDDGIATETIGMNCQNKTQGRETKMMRIRRRKKKQEEEEEKGKREEEEEEAERAFRIIVYK